MKQSKMLEERIRRISVLFKELGYEITDSDKSEESYTAAYESARGAEGGIFIDRESRFLEVAYTFSFSGELSGYIKSNIEDMLKVCYEYGCYFNVQNVDGEINFSVFSKVYFAGLNYYALRDTLRDFNECIAELTELLQISNPQET